MDCAIRSTAVVTPCDTIVRVRVSESVHIYHRLCLEEEILFSSTSVFIQPTLVLRHSSFLVVSLGRG